MKPWLERDVKVVCPRDGDALLNTSLDCSVEEKVALASVTVLLRLDSWLEVNTLLVKVMLPKRSVDSVDVVGMVPEGEDSLTAVLNVDVSHIWLDVVERLVCAWDVKRVVVLPTEELTLWSFNDGTPFVVLPIDDVEG